MANAWILWKHDDKEELDEQFHDDDDDDDAVISSITIFSYEPAPPEDMGSFPQFFFHEYGRHVGGVPRSSLKGKETQHDDGE